MGECNKEEAVRAKNIAERMMQEKDFLSARKVIISAQNFCNDAEISKMQTVCDVHCSAEKKLVGGGMNWYKVIQVEQTADEAAINKQFKNFARQLHTDKNQFPGADAAFKLISEARRVLLDKKKRHLLDKKCKSSVLKLATKLKKAVTEEKAACSSNVAANQPKEKISLTFSTSCPFSDVWKKFLFKRAMRSQNCSKGFDAYDLDNTRGSQASKIKQTIFLQELSACEKGFDSNGGFASGQSKDDIIEKTIPTTEAGSKKSSGERKRKEVSKSGKSSFTEKSSGKRKKKEISESFESSDPEIDTNGGDHVVDDEYMDFLNRQKLGSAFEPIDEAHNIKCKSPLTKPATSHGCGSCCPSASGDSNLNNENNFANMAQPELSNGSLTFLTICPCCAVKAECHKSIMERALRCQNCNKSFIAYDCVHCNKKRKKDNKDKYFKTGQNSGSKLLRTSGRLMEKFYNEILGDDDDDQHGDVDEVVMISDDDDDEEEEEDLLLPRPDFNDFDKKRGKDCFAVNQIWALYDSLDTMPRFYALINEVMFLPRSSIRITWLEAEPEDESETKWVDEGLPIGCGKFKVGSSEVIEGFSKFSHLVSCRIEGGEDTCTITPIKGEIWALFKDWNINWKFDTNPYGKYEYELVEILSDYNEGCIGTSVAYLSKVKGFVSVFRRTVCDDGASTFHIPLSQRFRFAHRVPYFELNGEEREGVSRGSFELDPASLPDSIVHVNPYEDLEVAGTGWASRPKNPLFSLTTTTSSLQQLYLEIPRSYIVSGAALPTTIFLRLSTGLMWHIKLSEEGKNVRLTEGWKEFVEYSSLKVGHVVAFEHSKSKIFNVRVFVNKDTEIEYPLDNVVDIKPQATLSGDNGYSHDFTTNPSYSAQETRGNTCTVELRQATLDEAKNFKSDYKFFKKTICPSHIGRLGGVALPRSFVMEHVDKSKYIKMALKVGEKSWNILVHTRLGKKGWCKIQRGWVLFARDNDLKVNDVCFFEITRKGNPAELTVSIFRAARCLG